MLSCLFVFLQFFIIFHPCWSHEQVFTTPYSSFKMLPSLFYFCAWPPFLIFHFISLMLCFWSFFHVHRVSLFLLISNRSRKTIFLLLLFDFVASVLSLHYLCFCGIHCHHLALTANFSGPSCLTLLFFYSSASHLPC